MEVWGGNESATREVALTGLDAWVYCQPHLNSRTGGDVYYLSSCASGRISRLLIADVAGHGDDAGKTARALRELMRRNINYINQPRLVDDNLTVTATVTSLKQLFPATQVLTK